MSMVFLELNLVAGFGEVAGRGRACELSPPQTSTRSAQAHSSRSAHAHTILACNGHARPRRHDMTQRLRNCR